MVLLDASQAFDRVNYCKLFDVMLKRNVCSFTVRLLINMYTTQRLRVKWGNTVSDSFTCANGVKQGGVLHRPPKVFGQSCLPVVILHVQCFGVHISSLYGPIILIFSSIGQQYIENIYRRFSENRIYFNTRNIEIEKS